MLGIHLLQKLERYVNCVQENGLQINIIFDKWYNIVMKIVFYSFFIFIASMGYANSSNMSWDNNSDEQIKSCLSSDTFQNKLLNYFYEDRNWELRIIFNPHYEQIILNNGQPSMFQFYYGVFTRDNIPESLESHLKEIIIGKLKSEGGGMFCISSFLNNKLGIDFFTDAKVATVKRISQTNSQKVAGQKCADVNPEICELFKEQTFKKLSLNYKWDGQSYLVHFVYNPLRETLFCGELSNPVRWPFAMTIAASIYPLSLANHLKSLVPEELLKDSDSMIDVADWVTYKRKKPVSLYTTLDPITLLNRIENPDIDVEILNLFTSNQLTRKSLYYELDGNFYGVFLIHNPEKLSLTSTINFNTRENGRISYTGTWNSKIGIFVNKEAPKELIDHLSQLYELSWWDRCCNLSIHNGNEISMTYSKNSWKYTYTPCSWYTFMLNAN